MSSTEVITTPEDEVTRVNRRKTKDVFDKCKWSGGDNYNWYKRGENVTAVVLL